MTQRHLMGKRSSHGKVSITVALAVTLVAAALIVLIGTRQGAAPASAPVASAAPAVPPVPTPAPLQPSPQTLIPTLPALPVPSVPAAWHLSVPPGLSQRALSLQTLTLDGSVAHATAEQSWTRAQARVQALRLFPVGPDAPASRRRAQPKPQDTAMTHRALTERP